MASLYKNLLSSERLRASTISNRNIITEAESDRGRLLFCPALRRLQKKAQVFSLEPNAAVRSRLTHSLEVSQMGRYLADQICIKLIDKKWAEWNECAALVTFVETACLMHDIGNPPFGHFGEAAIAEWFKEKGHNAIIKAFNKSNVEFKIDDSEINEALADFKEFDGNPQGLRVVAKLQRNSDEYGLNLTKTTLAAYLKYVRSSAEKSDKISSPFTNKCGYFVTESDVVYQVWQQFGYNKPQRFPLAYIMEAADDIAYCISDLEDSIEKSLLEKSKAFHDIYSKWEDLEFPSDNAMASEIDRILVCARNETNAGKPFTFTDFRTQLNSKLINYCTNRYIDNHDLILDGSLPSLIEKESPAYQILHLLKDYCRVNVYRHEMVQRVELAGYAAISGLLNHFACLLECNNDRFALSLKYENKDRDKSPIIIENKLLSLFPKKYIQVYYDDIKKVSKSNPKEYFLKEWNLRAHLVTDFISGMTDHFAMTTYQMLSGMKL